MNCMDTFFGSLLKKLKIFQLLQFAWIIELYFFAYMSIIGFLKKNSIVYLCPPKLEYCLETLLSYFEKYNSYILLVSIILFFCGMCMMFFKDIIWIKEYESVNIYCDMGVEVGIWFFLIYITYKIYILLDVLFLFTPLLVWLIYKLVKYLIEEVKMVLINCIMLYLGIYIISIIICI